MNNRRSTRKDNTFDVWLKLSDMSGLWAKARDNNAGGLFLEPLVGYIDGELMEGGDILEYLGDFPADMTVFDENRRPFMKSVVFPRWTGYSQRHKTMGLGVQYKHDYDKMYQMQAAA